MPLKSIQRTATVAWSPANPNDPLLATGTVAGALDDSFSNTTELEIFRLGLDDKDATELSTPAGVVSSNARFNRLSWGGVTADRPLGVIAGGLENGELMLWDPDAIINGNAEGAELFRSSNHSGAVCGLDFNPFQNNLLASAGGNGEIFVWDLANLSKPYSPGPRSSKLEDITCLAWNRQVQHIMATSSGTGYTVVWDLKNRREVLHLNYGGAASGGGPAGLSGRRGVTAVAWNPDGATQLVTASEDDGNPVILTWDLRNARAPEKILRGHSMGVLGLSWCRMDSNLLLSAGKDNRVLCWNPRDGEVIGELPPSNNWAFDVQWCPRNPNLLSVASFDGKVNVYSVQSDQAAAASQASTIAAIGANADDPFNLNASAAPTATSLTLKTPPKWLRRPIGATFGFGGKLVTFGAATAAAMSAAPGAPSAGAVPAVHASVSIRTAVTEPTLVSRSRELEQAIESKSLHAFCEARQKEAAGNAEEEATWKIIAVLFDGDARDRLVKILGRDREHVLPELTDKLEATTDKQEKTGKTDTPPASASAAATEDESATEAAPPSTNGGDALSGYFPESTAAESDFFSGASSTSAAEDAGTGAPSATFHILPADASPVDTLITRAVQLGDFDAAVRACLDADRLADALLLAVCGGNELLARTRQAYFERRANATPYLRLLRSVVGGSLADVVRQGDLAQWDEVLVVLCTYARGEEFSGLCAQLGDRLVEQWHAHKNREARQNAVLCYLAAGDLAKVAQLWIATESEVEQHGLTEGTMSASSVHALALQSLMEKVAVLRQ
ncbi:WD40-repeat-containing domain protein, partial [Syncephalis pseudoplumigaleata]